MISLIMLPLLCQLKFSLGMTQIFPVHLNLLNVKKEILSNADTRCEGPDDPVHPHLFH